MRRVLTAYRAVFDGVESQLELPVGGRDWLITVSLGPDAGLLVATDVTDRKRRERRLNDLAARDALTGAWNARRLNEEVDWLNRTGGAAALLMLDLDGFKRVNDTLGHVAGDELLRTWQRRCRAASAVPTSWREWAGTSLRCCSPAQRPRRLARWLRRSEGGRRRLASGCRGGVSIGVSAAGGGTGNALGRADRAMYADKQRAPERLASWPRAQDPRGGARARVPATAACQAARARGACAAALGSEAVEHRHAVGGDEVRIRASARRLLAELQPEVGCVLLCLRELPG